MNFYVFSTPAWESLPRSRLRTRFDDWRADIQDVDVIPEGFEQATDTLDARGSVIRGKLRADTFYHYLSGWGGFDPSFLKIKVQKKEQR